MDKIKIAKFDPEVDSLKNLTKDVQEAYFANVDFFGKEVDGVPFTFLYSREEMDNVVNRKTRDWEVGQTTKDGIFIFSHSIFEKVSNHPKEDFFRF